MKLKIPIQVIELEEDNFHLIIQTSFNDGSKGNWAIDTGASKTVFDINLNTLYTVSGNGDEEIQSAGIGEKLISTSVGIMKSFKIGNQKIINQKVALLDLSHINKHYGKAANLEICGLIGGDILMKHQAVIDYKRKLLILKYVQ